MKQVSILFALIMFAGVCYSQTEKPCCNLYPKTISVSGSAEMEVTPDEIYVEVTLREYKKKGEDKKDMSGIKTEFLALCKSMDIADSNIVVSDYEGYSNYYYYRKSRKQTPDMYAAVRYRVKFKDMANANTLADKLDDEAVQKFDITVSHSRISEFRKKLKIEAVKAAKDKAIYLAEAINEKVGEAVKITEPGDQAVQGYARLYSNTVSQARLNYNDDSPDTSNIQYKKIKLRYEVEVLFALK